MKRNEFAEILAPTVALILQLVQALAKAIAEVVTGLINAGMGA